MRLRILLLVLLTAACAAPDREDVPPVVPLPRDDAAMVPVPGEAVLAAEARLRRVPRLKSAEPFLIDADEVTVARYRTFCLATGRAMPAQPPGSTELHPVVNVTWDDADAFARWAGKRLPTAYEWWAAALGDRPYPWGNEEPLRAPVRLPLTSLGADRNPPWIPAPVGSDPVDTSTLGCRDMGGNVCEWTSSEGKGEDAARWRLLCGWRVSDIVVNDDGTSSTTGNERHFRAGYVGFRCARTP
jgi:formylglycine-generating enzyme required for sulfatase activity